MKTDHLVLTKIVIVARILISTGKKYIEQDIWKYQNIPPQDTY